jgi:DNA-binding response OmpR family regulator
MLDMSGYPMNDVLILVIDADEIPLTGGTVATGSLGQFCFTRMRTLSEGLNALQGHRFHAVLLNLSLPDTSMGDSVTKTLEKARDLPVVALVNKIEIAKVTRALRLGADDYVVKGCNDYSLVESLRHAIERKQLMGQKRLMAVGQLTAHLSHELRNALACIHQFGTIMIDGLAGPVSEEQREYLCIILENASKIRSVVDETLEGNAALDGD